MTTEKDVHTEHCCFRHGFCKYGNSLCPVTSGAKKQSHPCEQCMDEVNEVPPQTDADRVRGLQSNISDAMEMLADVGLAKHEVEPFVIRVQAAVDEIKRLRAIVDVVQPPVSEPGYRKVPCRKCGLTDEMCLCVAKAYIVELEAKIEKLESDLDDRPPLNERVEVDPQALDLCQCNHERIHHSRGTKDNNFDTKCGVTGCYCEVYYRRQEEETPELFYVQDSRTFTGNCVTWWALNGNGYTTHIDEAGKFPANWRKDGWRDHDVLWPVEVIDKLWKHHVDMQDLRGLTPAAKNGLVTHGP